MSTTVREGVMSQPDAVDYFHLVDSRTRREAAEHVSAGYAPPLRGARPAARQWVNGGVYHMIDWRDIERRVESLRAEGRDVGLRCIGNGHVMLRYTSTLPERFHAAEGAECEGEAVEANAAHAAAEAVGGA